MSDSKEKGVTPPQDVVEIRPVAHSPGDLIVEPEEGDRAEFSSQLERTLEETERQARRIGAQASAPDRDRSWERAREIVADFRPAPWFIWRLVNFVLGQSGQINSISEGLVFGLRRLIFAAASDPVLGCGEKVNDVRQALKIVPADVIAATALIHAVCRRMHSRPFERIWRPVLDDALLRARIGHRVGMYDPQFGPGRGMLAGFAGRCGLAVLISSGELDQARQALEMLATGAPINKVGLGVYQCEPLHVSALLLSAGGCGRDAAFGTAGYSLRDYGVAAGENLDQQKWLAAFVICEGVRLMKEDLVDEGSWTVLGFVNTLDREALFSETRKAVRQGHGWNWMA